ncbi:MAG: LysE family translocator [Nonlabens sp.]
MIENYLLFVVATLSLALSPGPDNIFVLTQSVARGAKYGIAIASGLITGCIVHTSLVALGFAVIIRDHNWLLLTIKILGALYLLYLARQTYTEPVINFSEKTTLKQRNLKKSYLRGITMNLLNPKVTLFFLALLPQFVVDNDLTRWIQIYLLGFIFMGVSLLVFYGIALLSDRLAKFINTSSRFPIIMKWLQIVVFVGIALLILIP